LAEQAENRRIAAGTSPGANKTKLLAAMFLTTALAVGSIGCSDNKSKCYDDNKDGYCDDDGSSVGRSAGYSGGHYYYVRGSKPSGTVTGGNGVTSSGTNSGTGGSSTSGSNSSVTTSQGSGSFTTKGGSSNSVSSGSKGGIGSSSKSSSS